MVKRGERHTDRNQAVSKNATPMLISELVGCGLYRTGYEDVPTMVNSTGMRMRRIKKMALSAGHPSDLRSFQLLGLRTGVSQAATVRVQTKKYL